MKNIKTYAGIGARKTPPPIYRTMVKFGAMRAKIGTELNTGGAPGADTAFLEGHYSVTKNNVNLFLPWDGFENHYQNTDSNVHAKVCRKAHLLGKEFYNKNKNGYRWDNLSQGVKKLQARNCYQILGLNLDSPVDFVICWTPEGKEIGGTGQAIRIANHYDIPIINLGNPSNLRHVEAVIKEFE